ncbi:MULTISPECIES: zinc finger domain-containing protein [unclassified Actinobaculum]|uniref:Fpg/Nei family DNA glycosylase n=1 Tax=unclassified Actinobaculum TaxID=2609299 RepID=UPI000D529746|nr:MULTISPECIES: zinc finger domain-containing protein [unclassified Actinobaculum]AWE43113.1 endonuclease VIII [Actinobaculum sp. 313]RTE48505.1 endonuclease VIII [Actinobaculum sp. 352]
MPEGQAIHRLARIISQFVAGRQVVASSPQGRFTAGAHLLTGLTALEAQAWGKHFFLPFVETRTPVETHTSASTHSPVGTHPSPAGPACAANARTPSAAQTPPGSAGTSPFPTPPEITSLPLGDDGASWLHVHLGLYGRWSFAGPRAETLSGAGIRAISPHTSRQGDLDAAVIGDESGRVGEESGVVVAPAATSEGAFPPPPRPSVRLRLETDQAVLDLTGPARCEVLSGAEVDAVLDRLGPDPIRNEPGDRARFISLARTRRAPIGQIVLDQSVAAGPGNIYRADCLFRVGIAPLRPAARVSATRLGALWDDLVTVMRADVGAGLIRTVPEDLRPSPVPPDDVEAEWFAVYHRTGRPCLRCGAIVRETELSGRRLFWCPGCQH